MSRVIVCKLGRLGEIRKILDRTVANSALSRNEDDDDEEDTPDDVSKRSRLGAHIAAAAHSTQQVGRHEEWQSKDPDWKRNLRGYGSMGSSSRPAASDSLLQRLLTGVASPDELESAASPASLYSATSTMSTMSPKQLAASPSLEVQLVTDGGIVLDDRVKEAIMGLKVGQVFQSENAESPASPSLLFDSDFLFDANEELLAEVLADTNQEVKKKESATNLTRPIEEAAVDSKICKVCGDNSSGFHYGVPSCEACKAFFKRTVQGGIDYACVSTGNCEVTKRRRKACQACRLDKCLRMGMVKEGVRVDRMRGGRQTYTRRVVVQGHEETRPKSVEDNQLLTTLLRCEPAKNFNRPLKTTASTASTLCEIYHKDLVETVEWAKQIPGFNRLSVSDQMSLLKASCSEILLLSLLFRSLPRRSASLNFAQDFKLTQDAAQECGLNDFYAHCLLALDRFERLGVCKEEFMLLKALVLSNAEAKVDEVTNMLRFRSSVQESLLDYSGIIRSGNASLHVQNLLLLLPSVRQADEKMRSFWRTRALHDSEDEMSDLFREVMDIAR